MEEKKYMISDAAKQVEVESHVLRYWEEELGLPIKRNKLGYRYYTSEDVKRLKQVKSMKEQGLQLRAIKNALKREEEQIPAMAITLAEPSKEEKNIPAIMAFPKEEKGELKTQNENEEKAYRLQILLKNMMVEAVKEGNAVLSEQLKESVLKELDYQFRLQEEKEDGREAERIRREEEHYRKFDELLREKAGRKAEKEEKKEKRKKHSFF